MYRIEELGISSKSALQKIARGKSLTGRSCLIPVVAALLILVSSSEAGDSVNGYRRGVNIIAWPWGQATRNGSIEERIDRAKAAGFDFVRVGVEITPLLKEGADRDLERTIQAAVARTQTDGIGLLLTLFARDKAVYRTGRLICGVNGEPERYLNAFRRVVAMLPDSSSIAIEPLNEPPGGCSPQHNGTSMGPELSRAQWQFYEIVRKEKPRLTFIVNAGDWSSLDALLAFDPTPYLKDRNSIFIFHYYEPKLFTEQGMPFKPEKRLAQHVPWPIEDSTALAQARTDTLRAVDTDPAGDYDRNAVRTILLAEFERYPSEGTLDHLKTRFQAAANWANRNGLDARRIVVAEFGVARPGYTEGAAAASGAHYLSSVRAAAEANGFGWAIWDLDTGFAIMCGTPPDEKVCPEYASVIPAGH